MSDAKSGLIDLRKRRTKLMMTLGMSFHSDVKHQDGNVTPEEFHDLLSSIEASLQNSDVLANCLHEICSTHPISVRQMIVESTIYPHLVEVFAQQPTPLLLRALCELITATQNLARIALTNESRVMLSILNALKHPDLSHCALKFIRRLIHTSIWTRCLLVAVDVYSVLRELLTVNGPNKYLLRTIRYAVLRDPVYGVDGYSTVGGSLAPRRVVLGSFKNMIGDQKIILRISNYLNFGCTQRIVKPIWLILRLYLQVRDVNFVCEALSILAILAEYSDGMADDAINMAEFQSLARNELVLGEPNARVAAKLIDVLSSVCVSTDERHLPFMKKLLQYRRIVKWISSGPVCLKRACIVFLGHLCYLVSDSELSNMILSRKNVFSLAFLVRIIDEFDFRFKCDTLLLILNLLLARAPEKRYVIYEHCFLPMVFDCLASSLDDLLEAVLRTLFEGLLEFPDLITSAIMSDENYEILASLSFDQPDCPAALLAQAILSELPIGLNF